ncbi:MAG: response regulator [Rubrivivax sp.]|nr:response regulator [Rubrivivax sp.]
MTHSLRTFIVEDSPVIRENLIATLEEMLPLTVVGVAEDEAAAVLWLTDPANECELGIIDVFLKRGTGLGVLKAARKARLRTKLIVLSNFATPDVRQTCLALGADEVFDKSHDIEDLLSWCARLVAANEDEGGAGGGPLSGPEPEPGAATG